MRHVGLWLEVFSALLPILPLHTWTCDEVIMFWGEKPPSQRTSWHLDYLAFEAEACLYPISQVLPLCRQPSVFLQVI